MENDLKFIESIRIEKGRIRNIIYHQTRLNKTIQHHFRGNQKINLRSIVKKHLEVWKGQNYQSFEEDWNMPHKIKCRIIYGQEIEKVEFIPYVDRPIQTIKLVYYDEIDYTYKSVNRRTLDQLYQQKNDCNDIIVVKNRQLTDTYYGNIAFLQKGKWYTPKTPLLKGTMRSYLINKKVITPRDIKVSTINDFEKIAIFNAMIPFGSKVIDISSIIA